MDWQTGRRWRRRSRHRLTNQEQSEISLFDRLIARSQLDLILQPYDGPLKWSNNVQNMHTMTIIAKCFWLLQKHERHAAMWCDEMRKDEVDWGSLWVGLALMQGCWLPVSLACLIIYLIIVVVFVVDGDEEELSATVTGTVGQLTAMAAEIRDQTRVAVAVAAVSIRLFSLALRFQFGAIHTISYVRRHFIFLLTPWKLQLVQQQRRRR